jgi:vitamin B12 transporter
MNKIACNNQSRFFFKRWTRKSYSVYNSLSRVIHICVISISSSIVSLPGYSQETINSHNNYGISHEETLDEVVVSAQMAPVLQSELMRVVHIISKQEINQSPASNLSDLLEFVRGVDIRQRGGFGMQADVSIRGGSFDQVLILLNGINISDPQTGHHNLNLPVDIQTIEKIEILQGSGARIFGPNAFSGAINIITQNPEENEIKTSLAAGQFGYGSMFFSGGLKAGKFSNYISTSGSWADGFVENTDFQKLNIYSRSSFQTNEGKIDLQAGYNTKAFGANSFYSPRFPNQFEETKTVFASLKWESLGKIKLYPSIYFRRHFDRFELFRDNPPEWYQNHNYHMSNVAGAAINWINTTSLGNTSIGFNYRFEDINSNVLGHITSNPKPIYNTADSYYTKYYKRTGVSFLAEQSFYFKKFSVSAGLLAYYNTDIRQKVKLFPGIDIGYEFMNNQRLFASISKTLRLPTFTDLFYTGPTNTSNFNLEPEEAISFETGLKNRIHDIEIETHVFKRWGKNMIDWVMFEGDEKWQSMNHTKVDISGFEIYVKKPIKFLYNNKYTYSYLALSYTYIKADKSSGQMLSLYTLDYLKHKLDFIITLPIYKSGSINFNISRQHRAGSYMLYENMNYTNLVDFEPFWMSDIKLLYNFYNIRASVEISNLFNVCIVDIANVPQPGRWVKIGLEYNVKYK